MVVSNAFSHEGGCRSPRSRHSGNQSTTGATCSTVYSPAITHTQGQFRIWACAKQCNISRRDVSGFCRGITVTGGSAWILNPSVHGVKPTRVCLQGLKRWLEALLFAITVPAACNRHPRLSERCLFFSVIVFFFPYIAVLLIVNSSFGGYKLGSGWLKERQHVRVEVMWMRGAAQERKWGRNGGKGAESCNDERIA